MSQRLTRIHMGQARCAADLTDGSERGEYVPQDYILQKLGRPMRSVNLMYCYYPLDKGFPVRASAAFPDMEVKSQWDYPYEDYFTYGGGLHGSRTSAVFQQMEDIRRHGQDVTLTLTCDPHLPDEYLIALAQDLLPFGRVMLRLNHEATGNWFAFNRRASYEEIAAFFVHASDVIRAYAPNVQTVICIGGIEDPDAAEMVKEKEFAKTIPAADIWSVDKYPALHWGWPFDTALPGGKTHARGSFAENYALTKASYERFRALNGGSEKPMMLGEFNADGDVTGPYDQCAMVDGFFRMRKEDEEDWLTAVNFYQFRDRGRLGLETEDPNHPGVGIEQPVMQTFREWIADELFLPQMTECGEASLPTTLRWGSSEDAEGLALHILLKGDPHFCELTFADSGSYMLELNGRWFYKSPETHFVDLMPAFYGRHISAPAEMTLKIFAPPADGRNDLEKPDGLMNSYATVSELPSLRIEYGPVEQNCD